MSRPVIGIMGNYYLINDQYPAHAAGTMNCEAIVDLCDATPLIIPGDPNFVKIDDLMRICDGFLFEHSGQGPAQHCGHGPTPGHATCEKLTHMDTT